jgi:hypothetical protein
MIKLSVEDAVKLARLTESPLKCSIEEVIANAIRILETNDMYPGAVALVRKANEDLKHEITRLQGLADSEQRSAEMYARAWEREIGPPYRAKTHHIDCLVLTTRDRMQELNRWRALEARGIICFNCGKPHHTADCDQPEHTEPRGAPLDDEGNPLWNYGPPIPVLRGNGPIVGSTAHGVACHQCGKLPASGEHACSWTNDGHALCFRCGHG